jgi:hypothetical protein
MKSAQALQEEQVEKIYQRIYRVRKTAMKTMRSKHRFADYRYLRSVLRAYRYFEANFLLSLLRHAAPCTFEDPPRASWHSLRLLIEATSCQRDARIKSRWTRALEYALAQDIDPEDLVRFIRARNGIAGCAQLASETNPKRRRSPDSPQAQHHVGHA